MSLPDYIDVTLCMRLVSTLGHFIWQGIVVFLLLLLSTSLMRRSSSSTRYIVSLLALLLMAFCPAVTFVLLSQDDIASVPRITEQPLVALTSTLVIPDSGSLPAPASEPTVIAKTQAQFFDWRTYAPYVVMGYLAGVVVMLSRLFLALQGGRRLRRRSQPVDNPRLLVTLARQAQALGLSFIPTIGYCRQIVVPTLIGVLRPMILLPISLSTGLSDEQIEALLAHELAHVRRYDPIVNILQRVIEAVLFFHPCVWLISRRIRIERENCCDDLVLAGGVHNATYVGSLYQMAEFALTSQSGHPLTAVATLSAANRPSQLRQRILRVIDSPDRKPVRLKPKSNFVLILAGLVTTFTVIQLVASASLKARDDMATELLMGGNVYILGQVERPGGYLISEDHELTLRELITKAGGYNGEDIKHASITLSRCGTYGKRRIARKLGLAALTENADNDLYIQSNDLITLAGTQLYRPQFTVRLVVGKDRMTLQGQNVTWETLPAMLQVVPHRPYTMLCVTMAEGNKPTDKLFSTLLNQAYELAEVYGFEERGFGGIVPLGSRVTHMLYVPIESMHYSTGAEVPIDDSLLQTHMTNPPGRMRRFVRLVIGDDSMTFQGREVSWQQLPEILDALPDRGYTVFEIASASNSPPGDKYHSAEVRADELQKQYGFEIMRQLKPQPLGSVGSLQRYVANEDIKIIP